MNLKEFDEFRLQDAVRFHQKLNPVLFTDERVKPEVRTQLLIIAQDFLDHLGVGEIDVVDITLSGSNAAYTYTVHSDIDLHILVNVPKLQTNDVYRELFNSKKVVYNDTHDIKIHGYDVELYVQDANKPVKSLGEYSLLQDKWLKFPSRRRSNFDERTTREKFIKLVQLSELALRSIDVTKVDNLLSTLRRYRQAGLVKQGEFGPENLAYKLLRSRGIVNKLYKHRDDLHNQALSLDEYAMPSLYETDPDDLVTLKNEWLKFQNQPQTEDYDPNGPPPGPEFKPTMPQGTVRVDVSDVYDWYKLGQHISNMRGLGKHDFGKGPPSTIMSFGSEEQEHKYITDLQRTGLTTTDIDPASHKKIPGQKVDATFNVAESASGYIPSDAESNDPRYKTGLTVDVHPDTIKKNAKKLGLGRISRAGIPPTARSNGKIS